MRVIAIAWMFTWLGCAQMAAAPFELIGNAIVDEGQRDDARVARACAHTVGATRERCLAEDAPVRVTGARLRPRVTPVTEPSDDADDAGPAEPLSTDLDSAMIAEAVANVKTQVMSCFDESPATGQVLVSVKVAADGHVTDVTIKNVPEPALGDCIVTAIQQATFPKTQSGGSFRYPFAF